MEGEKKVEHDAEHQLARNFVTAKRALEEKQKQLGAPDAGFEARIKLLQDETISLHHNKQGPRLRYNNSFNGLMNDYPQFKDELDKLKMAADEYIKSGV